MAWCVVGRYYSKTISRIVYEKVNHIAQKHVKIISGTCSTCGRGKFQFFTDKTTSGESFIKNGKCERNTVHLCLMLHGVI